MNLFSTVILLTMTISVTYGLVCNKRCAVDKDCEWGDRGDAETVLKPYVKAYCDTIYAKKYHEVAKFYHSEAVLVETGKKIFHTPGDIATAIEIYREALNPANTTILKETYGGCGDILCYHNEWEVDTPSEVLRGPYFQVWKRDGNEYMLYHDEFCVETRTPKA